jgi:hypothetical protein
MLRERGEFALYRGRQPGNAVPILVLAAVAEQPAPASLRQLDHEYSLAAELSPKWAARPVALTRHDGRPVLVLEDPGGDPLDGVLGGPLELTRFLNELPDLASCLVHDVRLPGLSGLDCQIELDKANIHISHHFYDWPWRDSDHGQSHEGWSCRLLGQTLSAARNADAVTMAMERDRKRRKESLRACGPFSRP